MDYRSGPYEVTFAAGTTEASFNVSLTDDNIFESNENFMITIDPSSLPSDVTVGDPRRVTVIIMDNDGNHYVHELVNLLFYLYDEHGYCDYYMHATKQNPSNELDTKKKYLQLQITQFE